MSSHRLEEIARRMLGRRLEKILEIDPKFLQEVVARELEKMGVDPREPVIVVDERKREWRHAVKTVRKEAYYRLRRFRAPGLEVPLEERGKRGLEELLRVICGELESRGLGTVVDLGAGVFPRTLPQWPCRPEHYIAVEKSPSALRELEFLGGKVGDTVLYVINSDLGNPRLPEMIRSTGAPLPGLGLALRVFHVLVRTRRLDPVELVASLPLRGLVASEPTRSLVGGKDVGRREEAFLRRLGRRLVEAGVAASWFLVRMEGELVLVARF